MAWKLTGVIEGFYGAPWTWDQRISVAQWCRQRGMTHYLYAPKDDPKHRAEWRTPYTSEELGGFARFVASDTLRLGFAVSPGLSMDYDSDEDRATLIAKLIQMIDLGSDLVCLALDDIPPAPGIGEAHARLTTFVREHLSPEVTLVLVPTDYTSTVSTPYLDALAQGVPGEVLIAWTGPTVVCDRITREHARGRSKALGGRPPLIWENYPVNDGLMSDRLFLGPLRGREPGLADECCAYFSNPMVQPESSKLPLASIAGYLRDEDPEETWRAEADALSLRTFAEACDGVYPRALVESVIRTQPTEWTTVPVEFEQSLAALRVWIEAAETGGCRGLESEALDWLAQIRNECATVRHAIRAIEQLHGIGKRAGTPPDQPGAVETVMATIALWQHVSRSPHTVFGPRRGFRPVLSQNAEAAWRFHSDSVQQTGNATDLMVQFTLAHVDRFCR